MNKNSVKIKFGFHTGCQLWSFGSKLKWKCLFGLYCTSTSISSRCGLSIYTMSFFILHLLLKINFKGLMSIGFKIKRIVKKNVFSIGWEMTIGRLYRCVIQMLFDETRPPFFSTSYLSLPISQSLFHATEIWYRSPRWHTAPLIPLHIAPLFRSIYPSISPLSSSSPCSCFIWHMMRCHRSALE